MLSIVEEPDETLAFFNEIERCHRNGIGVFVDLEGVSRLQYDALVVLLSMARRFDLSKLAFLGNYPKDADADTKLKRSGFFDGLKHQSPKSSSFYSHHDRGVESKLTAGVIREAATKIWGAPRRCPRVQSVLIELMQNTNNHAEPRNPGEQLWWLSVDANENDHRALFAFVDFGVGVFKSLDGKSSQSPFFRWRQKLAGVFGQSENPALMKRILEGDLHRAVVIDYFRGKGLPGIFDALNRGAISQLRVVTNDVFANVATNDYKQLKNPFTGTLVYWELDRSNPSIPEVI